MLANGYNPKRAELYHKSAKTSITRYLEVNTWNGMCLIESPA